MRRGCLLTPKVAATSGMEGEMMTRQICKRTALIWTSKWDLHNIDMRTRETSWIKICVKGATGARRCGWERNIGSVKLEGESHSGRRSVGSRGDEFWLSVARSDLLRWGRHICPCAIFLKPDGWRRTNNDISDLFRYVRREIKFK